MDIYPGNVAALPSSSVAKPPEAFVRQLV